jgi:hypothetical protein
LYSNSDAFKSATTNFLAGTRSNMGH